MFLLMMALTLIPKSDGYYTIRSVYSGLVLDVLNISKDDSANIIQMTDHGGDNQLWRLKSIKS